MNQNAFNNGPPCCSCDVEFAEMAKGPAEDKPIADPRFFGGNLDTGGNEGELCVMHYS
jgi:hypothetical protein